MPARGQSTGISCNRPYRQNRVARHSPKRVTKRSLRPAAALTRIEEN